MTLDLARIVERIDDMIAGVDPARESERFDALRVAWEQFDSIDVNARLDTAKTSFLLARNTADYQQRFPLPAVPHTYAVAATDGSMIAPDRHSPARFYLMNIGKVMLRYGDEADASFTSEPDLRYAEEDLMILADGRRIAVNEVILGLRRASAELRVAADMIADVVAPSIALLDGTLILWSLQGQEQAVIDSVLPEFLAALRTFEQQGQPVASYISAPGAADLMNTVRVSICDYPDRGWPVNCDHCRRRIASEGHVPACDILPGVPDRYLLHEIARLQPGERTTVYGSGSNVLDSYDDDLRIVFFYLNAGHEIGRVEIPQWVARDRTALDLVHAVIWDQCQLGRGYPVALQEAHEVAVLNMADRRLIEEVIERRLASLGIVMTRTGKDGSKRGRFV